MQATIDGQTINDDQVHFWINQLEQLTNVFYNEATGQNQPLWREAQSKLLQFQKIPNPFELCTQIIKKSRNSLVLYQATLCLKNAVANDFKNFDSDELFKLFQFLYEFLCAQALENDMSVNETAALICAIILKQVASEKNKSVSCGAKFNSLGFPAQVQFQPTAEKTPDKITQVITTLCNNIKDLNQNLSTKIASALMLNSLLLECQMSNRSTVLGIKIWKHLHARRLLETHLKLIMEVCLETINWAFSSNLLNPTNQNRETKILFHLVGTLIQCVEYSLSFDSNDANCSTLGCDRILRVIQSRTISMLSRPAEHDQRRQVIQACHDLVMSPAVVQFLFNLYATVKSMINCTPGWDWPANILKNCLNCLYFLSDIQNSILLERDEKYLEFVGNMMLGSIKIMDSDVKGIDDNFQIACLMTSISISETRDTITNIKAEHFVSFLDAAQRFTCKVFTQVATTQRSDEEEEEEKTVDALLDFWFHILRNIEAEIRWAVNSNSQKQPKISADQMKAYSRFIIESYISCHLHKPIGQLIPKSDDMQELDLDQIEDHDDGSVHNQQLVSFGHIARIDALHTSKLLIELLSTRLGHFEALLTEYITKKPSPDGLKDWEYINDDLHWLLLMAQHFLLQNGYGELGFMCDEILTASMSYERNVQKTLEAFEKFDYQSSDVDPIVRLIIACLKLCQIEMGICQSGNLSWLSVQTNGTLTTFLMKFCLTYLFPKESDYTVISETLNYCFGQDSAAGEKFLKFVIEHTCCIILCMKSDPQTVNKNVQLLIHLLIYHPNVKNIMFSAEDGSMIKMFVSQMRPEHFAGFSSRVAKSIVKLATKLFVEDDDWNKLIEFFTNKWGFIMSSIQNQQHQSEMVSNKFLEFCDFAMGVCEACDEDTSERLFEQLLMPIVKALPSVLRAFGNFETVPTYVFELLYYIVQYPMVNISGYENEAVKSFYMDCSGIMEAYSQIACAKKNRTEEDDCEDIISVLTFNHELMKRDWALSSPSCDSVVRFAVEKLSLIMKPEYLQFPRIRTMYYRILVYLVDDDDRLSNLGDSLLNTIVSSVLLALQSQFDRDVDNHTYTIIGIICRFIYHEKGTPLSERLAKFMLPVLPVLFKATLTHGSYAINTDMAEMVAPALFSLRCCFPELYQNLVKELIEKQDDLFTQKQVRYLFEAFESKIHHLILNRNSCREFTSMFVPFLSELHNYITVK